MSAKHPSAPATGPSRDDDDSSIAGVVLPIARAEELLGTLPGVLNVRVIAGKDGDVIEVHVLTTTAVSPKQTVRNVESALLAQLGMRVSHKKISVATSEGPAADAIRAARMTPPLGIPVAVEPSERVASKRRLYFEDVEIRRSRIHGMSCRVTVRRGDDTFVGEASGQESDRLRIETSARAAVTAVLNAEVEGRALAFEGARLIEAFDREFVFVALMSRVGREMVLLTGSAEVRDGVETASVLAVLDATNRWAEF